MGGFGLAEIGLVVIVAILVYGKDLPQVARKAARAYAKAKRYMASVTDEINRHIPEDDLDINKHIEDSIDRTTADDDEDSLDEEPPPNRMEEEVFDPSKPPPDDGPEATSEEPPTPQDSPAGKTAGDDDPAPAV